MSDQSDQPTTSRRNPHDDELDSDEEEIDLEGGGCMIGDVYIPPPPPKPTFSGEETGRRLIITNITNVNFKSYAGTCQLGPFHKSFTSIVGPNGSGKSNVIDSMLFVFGYRAQKLRSKKLSVLIHNSDTHPDLDYCEVHVHFAILDDQGGDDHNIVPGSDFTVTRTASKDNTSSYYIRSSGSNKKKVSFKEVSKLLESHGVDLRYNRFLILQGEVEQIALMKPKAESEHEVGMLEFLEDIFGSNRLKAPLQKLQERVDEMNELRGEKMNRLKAVASEKDALKGPRDEAIDYLKTENDIIRKQNLLYQVYRQNARESLKKSDEKFKKAEAILAKAMTKVNAVVEERNQISTLITTKETDFANHLSEFDRQTKLFEDLERKDSSCREKIKHTKSKGKKLEEELSKEQKKLEGLKAAPAALQDDVEVLEIKKDALEKDKKEADEELEKVSGELKQQTEELQAKKDPLEQKKLSFERDVNAAKSKKELAQSEFDLYVSHQRTERSKLDQLKFKLNTNQREIHEKKTSLKTYTSKLPDMERQDQSYQQELDSIASEKQKLNQELRILKSRESEARSKMTSSRSRKGLLASLMEQKRKGKLSGIIGRLGDLGTIDSKYDVAVSTACGRLDNIVVETVDDAQAAIQYLKDANLGRTTFIALDKISNNWEGAWENFSPPPENCPRLFDLIRVREERFRAVFYYAITDTIVADDLTQGTRIFNQRRMRIVTLAGKMMEPSGAMSGGGQPLRGRMGCSTTNDEDVTEEMLKEMQDDIRSKQRRLEEIDERAKDLLRKQEELASDMNVMKANAPKVEMEIKSLEDQLEILRKNIDATEISVKESTPDPEKVKELDKKRDEAEREYSSVNNKFKALEDEIEKIDNEINEVVKKTLGSAKKKVNNLKSELDSVSSELAKKEAAKKSAERNIEKCSSKIEQLNKEVESSVQLIKDLKEELKKLEVEGEAINKNFIAIKEQKKTFEAELNELRKKVSDLSTEESQLMTENLDAKHEVDKLKAVVDEKGAQVRHFTEKLSSLRLQAIPDEDEDPEEDEEIEIEEEVELDETEMELQDENGDSPAETSQLRQKEEQEGLESVDEQDCPETQVDQTSAEKPKGLSTSPEESSKDVSSTKKMRVILVKKKLSRKILEKDFPQSYLMKFTESQLKADLSNLDEALKAMKPNMAAIEDYKKKVKVYLERTEELNAVTSKRDMFKDQFEQLRSTRLAEFKEGFHVITRKLKEMYRMITSGGDAELEWADSLDPFSEGINFSVRPNKKSWKRISNLSGGEKTLSSLSLIFALHYYKPSPLYVMDEIDAALDFKNVSIVANYIKERTKNTQFIIISLRNNMYELANRLVGIFKTHNCTKSLTLIYVNWEDGHCNTENGTTSTNILSQFNGSASGREENGNLPSAFVSSSAS